ncbi:S41 family peptidase [Candidatus Parcubacteria bacterium]|nr:S41 family peptidase [Candidatus Parcubacteria bacterium]
MNPKLNKPLKLLIIVLIFAAGFFIGNMGSSYAENKNANIDIKTFWKVWDILDEEFVTTKHKDKLGNEISTSTETEFDGLSKEERRLYGAIKGMVESEQDPYTAFFTPQEAKSFETEIKGSFEGIGMEVGKKDGVITVIAPIIGSPSEKAGLKTGDKIIKINGQTTIDMTVDEAVKIIRGEKGTVVTLQVYREGVDKPLDFKITRDIIQLPTLDKSYDKKTGIYTIKVYSFSEQVDGLFKQAMTEFVSTKSDKLIIDLRGNPGGYLESAVDMASYFVPQGKVVVSQDYGEKKQIENLRSSGYTLLADRKVKLVVLIDGGSASASEIVAGALQDYKLATLLGEKSFGKGSVQEYIKITSKTGLKVTIARWLTPNGNSISVSGLTPDLLVPKATSTTIQQIKDKTDNQYLKAVEFLNK